MSNNFNLPISIQKVIKQKTKVFTTQYHIGCKLPIISGIDISNITTVSFDIGFTLQNTSHYKIEVREKYPQTEWDVKIENTSGSGNKLHTIDNLKQKCVYQVLLTQYNSNNNICTETSADTSDLINILEQETESDGTNCLQPVISKLSTTEITHNSFIANFSLLNTTNFTMQYKVYSTNIEDGWVTYISDGTSDGDKSYIITSNIQQNTKYHWRIIQVNAGDGICTQSISYSNPLNTNTIVDIPICQQIINKPIITSPDNTNIITQNTYANISWIQAIGTNVNYNVYIDGNIVNTQPITDTVYSYKFTQQKAYTIQIGQYNSCTLESQNTKSSIFNLLASNIINCIPISGIFQITSPTNSNFIEIGIPFTIRWEIPNYGTDIKYTVYINEQNITPTQISNNFIVYIFEHKQEYIIRVEQDNICSVDNNVVNTQSFIIRNQQLIDKKNTTFEIYYKHDYQTEFIVDYIPLLGSNKSTDESIQNYPIIAPNNQMDIVTSYERYFRIKILEIQSNKKIKNFKIFCNNQQPQIGVLLYYKTEKTFNTPISYKGIKYEWAKEYNYKVLQNLDNEVNLFIDGSQNGEITQAGQYTDYGVLLCEVSQDQVSTEQEFLIYIQWDDFEI